MCRVALRHHRVFRRAPLSTIALLLGGCLASLPPRAEQATQTIFDPTRFFAGHTRGEGTLDFRFGSDRTLRVEGSGRMEADDRFRLDQVITFGDRSVETRVWILQRVDATYFTATLSDAKSTVQAETHGARFHLRYLRVIPRYTWSNGSRSMPMVAPSTIRHR